MQEVFTERHAAQILRSLMPFLAHMHSKGGVGRTWVSGCKRGWRLYQGGRVKQHPDPTLFVPAHMQLQARWGQGGAGRWQGGAARFEVACGWVDGLLHQRG